MKIIKLNRNSKKLYEKFSPVRKFYLILFIFIRLLIKHPACIIYIYIYTWVFIFLYSRIRPSSYIILQFLFNLKKIEIALKHFKV